MHSGFSQMANLVNYMSNITIEKKRLGKARFLVCYLYTLHDHADDGFNGNAEHAGGPSGPEPVLVGRQKLDRRRLQAVLMRQMVLRTMDSLPDVLLKNLNVKLPLDKQLALVREMYCKMYRCVSERAMCRGMEECIHVRTEDTCVPIQPL